MRVSDIVAHLNLDVFPSVGLVLFFGTFLLVGLHVLTLGSKGAERDARIPLEDEPILDRRASE